jgi:hypothetical protein
MQRAVAPLFAVLLAFAAVAPVGAEPLAALHERGGFLGARLGSSIDSFEGLELIGADAATRTRTYIRRSDNLGAIGGKVDTVTYSFYDGRLYFISVQMTGSENAEAVRTALEQIYGVGMASGNHPNEMIWPGGEVFVLFDIDAKTGRGLAAMTSTLIHARMHTDRIAATDPAR